MPTPTRATSPPSYPSGCVRSLVAGATVATATIQLLAEPASALDLDSDGGLITETVASRDRLKHYDSIKTYGAERVSDRDRDFVQPDGIRAGNHLIFPSVGAAVVFDDNIFASNRHKVSDIRSVVTPQLHLQSQLPRHVLDLSLGGKIVNYLDETSQDYADVRGQLDGALHFDHAHTLSLSTLTAIEHEERGAITSSRSAAEPVEIHHSRVVAGITRDVGRLYGTFSAGLERWDYSNTTSITGGVLRQDQRDLDVASAQLKLGYRFSPGYEFIGKLRALRQWNRGDTVTDYDAIGYEVMAGLAFETNPLLRWRLLGGYGFRDYEQSDIDSLGSSLVEGRVQWLATQRMTIYGTVSRAIMDRIGDEDGGRIENRLHGKVEYEVYHNTVLTMDAEIRDTDFIGSTRHDRLWGARLGVDYYLSKNWLMTFGYEYQQQNSNDDDFDVNRNRFTIGAKLRF